MTHSKHDASRALRAALALTVIAACAPALAQARMPLLPLAPEIEHRSAVAYVSGGLGIVGRQHTIELGSHMNLELVFTRMPDAVYLADVDVTISDVNGRKVLELAAADPLLFVQLQPGRYLISATVDGRTIERKVRVPADGMHTEFIHWRDVRLVELPR